MRKSPPISSIVFLVLVIFSVPHLVAQSQQNPDLQQLKQRMQQLEQEMQQLKGQISSLEGAQPAPAAQPTPTPAPTPPAPPAEAAKGSSEGTMDIYGAVMLDAGYDFKTNNPDWFDVMRPTQLPSTPDPTNPNSFLPDGKTYFGVRQSRFGVKTSTPTKYGDLKTIFEFELFGTGVDAGQTTFRLRHAYGELGQFGAGQTWSPFMDIDVFPNSLEYWGPNGMVFFRNVQFRWMPIRGDSRVTIAVERPGASADGGVYAGRIELSGVKPKFDMPDFSWEARLARHWGYVEAAGIFRKISWVDNNRTPTHDLSGDAFGWGINLSSNLKFNSQNTGRFQVIYGEGVENYMNDAPIDVGVKNNFSNPKTPIKGVPLPVLGVVSFLDHNWSEKFSSAIGYSLVNITNSDAETASDFHQGHYALADLLYYPMKNVMIGGEFQWGRRVNFADGFNTNDYRLQFGVKYNFSKTLTY